MGFINPPNPTPDRVKPMLFIIILASTYNSCYLVWTNHVCGRSCVVVLIYRNQRRTVAAPPVESGAPEATGTAHRMIGH